MIAHIRRVLRKINQVAFRFRQSDIIVMPLPYKGRENQHMLSHMLPVPKPYGAGFECVGGGETKFSPGILCFHTIVLDHYVTFRRLKVVLH